MHTNVDTTPFRLKKKRGTPRLSHCKKKCESSVLWLYFEGFFDQSSLSLSRTTNHHPTAEEGDFIHTLEHQR